MSKSRRVDKLEQKVRAAHPRIVVVWPEGPEPAAASEPGAIVLRVRYVDVKAT